MLSTTACILSSFPKDIDSFSLQLVIRPYCHIFSRGFNCYSQKEEEEEEEKERMLYGTNKRSSSISHTNILDLSGN